LKLKIENSLESLLSENLFELAHSLHAQGPLSFSEQVVFLGLDPKHDLRHSDLSYIDLSNSDVRGFDFAGANLHGATGVNVRWDSTTGLTDADTSDSLFAYSVDKQRFFNANPHLAERVGLLANDYWANTIIRVAEMLQSSKHRDESLRVARAVFEDSKDPTVRSDLLSHMINVTNVNDHKTFIYHLLSRASQDPTILRPALNALKSFYLNDLDAFNMMLKYLSHPDKPIQNFALSGIIRSAHFFRAFAEVRDLVLHSNNPMMRRTLVGRIARTELMRGAPLLEDDTVINYVDFRDRISLEKLKAMSRRSFGRVSEYEIANIEDRFQFSHRKTSDGELGRACLIRVLLSALGKKYKIPFDLYDGHIA
jgi:hypothetical protein